MHHGFTNAGSLAAVLLIATAPLASDSCIDKVIIELPREDSLTIPPEVIIKECSKVLSNREKQADEAVAKALTCRGRAYLDIGKGEPARQDFEELCKLRPRDPDALLKRALALGVLGRLDDAIQDAKGASILDPRSPDAHTILANLFKVSGDSKKALEAATTAIRLDATYAMAFYIRGLVYYDNEEPARCVDDLNRFLELSPFAGLREPDKPYLVRGLALIKLSRPKEAMCSILMANKLNPHSLKCLSSLSNVYATLGKWHLAARLAQECAQMAPTNLLIQMNNASAYAKIGKPDEAIQSIQKALRLSDPRDMNLVAAIGDVYKDLGKYEESLRYYDTALKRDPDCFGALTGKACILSTCPEPKLRDGQTAKRLALQAHNDKRMPEWKKWETLMPLAEAHAECGEFKEAIGLAKKALESVGSDLLYKTEILKKLGLFEKEEPYRAPTFGSEKKE
jgi:tetratricopeptide (TPR) repeat protein